MREDGVVHVLEEEGGAVEGVEGYAVGTEKSELLAASDLGSGKLQLAS